MSNSKKKIGIYIATVLAVIGLVTAGLLLSGPYAEGDRETGDGETAPDAPKQETTAEIASETQTDIQMETQTETEETPEAFANLQPESSVTALSCDDINGSCIVWERGENFLVLLTAAHVVKKEPERVWLEGQPVTVLDYWKSADYDMAFLKVGEDREPVFNELKPVMQDAEKELRAGDEIALCGVIDKEKVRLLGTVLDSWILVEDFGYHMLWAEAENAKGGMSGGGVFDGEGNLVGMLLGSDGDSQVVALPLTIIVGEWEGRNLAGTLDISAN